MVGIHKDLLTTKIYRPPLPADCVQRSDLLSLLEAGLRRPLTLICAPAGYGKSVLASNWLEVSDWASVWVSLDENDSDLKRFLSYLSAAIRKQFPQAFETVRSLSQAATLPETRFVANIISNEMNMIDQPFLLVLDDYYRIHAGSPVNDVLRILLDQPPIPLHLVLLTRRDPPLPLSRLRAHGQVTDVRMQDLKFNALEIQELLKSAAQIRASKDAVANLDRELEGWVAGLRLLAFALRRAPDTEGFMKSLHGGTQQMQEYLVSEVIEGLPRPFRTWLLRSALLDRFCASLCEMVCIDANEAQTDTMTGREFIEQLKEHNLFIVSLDANGHWFRFHHLFQKLLQAELNLQLKPEAIAQLHKRTSHWFEENRWIEEAMQYALKAGDSDTAADILERHRLDELEKMRFHVIERWLEVLPAIPANRPALQLADAFVAIRQFDIPRLAAILERVTPIIEKNPDDTYLMGELRCLQGIMSYRMGDGETGQELLQEVRHRFQTSAKGGIAGTAAFHEALCRALCGHGHEALTQFEDLASSAEAANPVYHSLLISGLLIVSYFLGDLARTKKDATRLEILAKTGGIGFSYGLSIYFRACSDLHRGDFEAAAQRFNTHTQQRYTLPRQGVFSATAGLALCQQFLKHDDDAARTAGDLQTLAQELNDANGFEIARSCKARIQLLQGNLGQAVKWAGVDTTPPGFAELYNALEVPAITRARVWIALGSNESLGRADNLLQQVSERSRYWNFTNQTIEADVLKSLALAGLGREDEAIECLAATLTIAAPGGWIRPFLEPGKPMADLLVILDGHGLATDFSRQLHIEIEAWRTREADYAQAGSGLQMTTEAKLYETLTPREIDVLELLGQRLQNKEIADKLFVSPETVKSHLRNIYQKLDVGKRREAVEKARKLEIIQT